MLRSRLPAELATAGSTRYVRWFQVVLYVAIALFSILTCVTLAVTYQDLKGRCPLYAKPGPKEQDVVSVVATGNGTHYLKIDGVKFEDSKTCYYTIYLNATAAVYSIFWGLLFAFLSSPLRNKRGYLRKMVFPSLLFNAVIFTCQLISSCVLTLGFTHWCTQLVNKVTASNKKPNEMVWTCPTLQSMKWNLKEEITGQEGKYEGLYYMRGSRFFALLTISQISSWLVSLTTLCLSLICAERFLKSVWQGDPDSPDNCSSSSGEFPSVTGQSGGGQKPNSRRGLAAKQHLKYQQQQQQQQQQILLLQKQQQQILQQQAPNTPLMAYRQQSSEPGKVQMNGQAGGGPMDNYGLSNSLSIGGGVDLAMMHRDAYSAQQLQPQISEQHNANLIHTQAQLASAASSPRPRPQVSHNNHSSPSSYSYQMKQQQHNNLPPPGLAMISGAPGQPLQLLTAAAQHQQQIQLQQLQQQAAAVAMGKAPTPTDSIVTSRSSDAESNPVVTTATQNQNQIQNPLFMTQLSVLSSNSDKHLLTNSATSEMLMGQSSPQPRTSTRVPPQPQRQLSNSSGQFRGNHTLPHQYSNQAVFQPQQQLPLHHQQNHHQQQQQQQQQQCTTPGEDVELVSTV